MLNPNLEQIQLNTEEYQRYSRHLILPEVGLDGQKRLKAASVLCIGTGGLGSPLLLYSRFHVDATGGRAPVSQSGPCLRYRARKA